VSLLIDSSESTSEATSEAFNVKINYDISTFFLSNLSDSLLQVQNLTVIQSKSRLVEAENDKALDVSKSSRVLHKESSHSMNMY